jgi:hypothetical protein
MSDMNILRSLSRHPLTPSSELVYASKSVISLILSLVIPLSVLSCAQMKPLKQRESVNQTPIADKHSSVSHSPNNTVKSHPTVAPLFVAEGSKTKSPRCKGKQSSIGLSLQALYIAKLQGGKSIVKELCQELSPHGVLRDLLPTGHCSSDRCGIYDAYRRGPLWFSLFMATLNDAIYRGEIRIYSAESNQEESSTTGSSPLTKHGLFEFTEQRRVQQQVVSYDMGPQIRCVARLKLYKDLVTQDRKDQLDDRNRRFQFTSPPSAGELWAEHRQRETGQGYEVLILERRRSETGGEGELLERELLCQSEHGPLDPLAGNYRFSIMDMNRDATRVFAQKTQ